jgi:predicted transcriptional regulator
MIERSEKLVEMVSKEPDLLKILKSNEHMSVLLEIYKKTQKIDNLKVNIYFKNVSILYNILDTLIHNKIVKKIEIDGNLVYYLTDKGKEFVEIYKEAKEKFNLNGGD